MQALSARSGDIRLDADVELSAVKSENKYVHTRSFRFELTVRSQTAAKREAGPASSAEAEDANKASSDLSADGTGSTWTLFAACIIGVHQSLRVAWGLFEFHW